MNGSISGTGKTSRARILVVDDEKLIRDTVSEFLKSMGYEVSIAESGAQALELLGVDRYDLLLTDIRMPGMSGVELLKAAHRVDREMACIMMTGYSELDVAVEAMILGAYDYVSKPFNFSYLHMSIEKALEKTRLVKLNKEYQNTLEQKVMEQSARIREMYTEAVASLTSAIEAKDDYTKGHSIRVTEYTGWLLDKMKLDFETKSNIIMAAQLHDVGKLGVGDAVLNKPGKLTDEEFDLVKSHPVTSEKILKPIIAPEPLSFVRHHHEKWDGRGYPDGLSGLDIPIGARIIALADTFDAMTSTRAYRTALSCQEAVDEIQRCSGSQFDPEFVPDFINVVCEHFPEVPEEKS